MDLFSAKADPSGAVSKFATEFVGNSTVEEKVDAIWLEVRRISVHISSASVSGIPQGCRSLGRFRSLARSFTRPVTLAGESEH